MVLTLWVEDKKNLVQDGEVIFFFFLNEKIK